MDGRARSILVFLGTALSQAVGAKVLDLVLSPGALRDALIGGLVIGGMVLTVVGIIWVTRPTYNASTHSAAGRSNPVEIRLASPLAGGECDEHYLDCFKLAVTNDGPKTIRCTVGVRLHGTGDRIDLMWEPHRTKETTIAPRGTARVPLIVRSREAGHYWDVHQPHGRKVNLGLGVVYVFDETFQVAANPDKILSTGRTFLGVDVEVENGPTLTQAFEVFVPSDYRKALRVIPQTAGPNPLVHAAG